MLAGAPWPWLCEEGPFEVHVVSFPNRAAFEAYQGDPELRILVRRRSEVIARPVLHLGRDGETDGGQAGSGKRARKSSAP